MATVNTRPTNGVSFGVRHVVAAGETGAPMVFDFDVDYPIVASVQVTDSTGAMVDLTDAVVTYPEDGQVSLEDGGTFALATDQVVQVVAQRARLD